MILGLRGKISNYTHIFFIIKINKQTNKQNLFLINTIVIEEFYINVLNIIANRIGHPKFVVYESSLNEEKLF